MVENAPVIQKKYTAHVEIQQRLKLVFVWLMLQLEEISVWPLLQVINMQMSSVYKDRPRYAFERLLRHNAIQNAPSCFNNDLNLVLQSLIIKVYYVIMSIMKHAKHYVWHVSIITKSNLSIIVTTLFNSISVANLVQCM